MEYQNTSDKSQVAYLRQLKFQLQMLDYPKETELKKK